MNMQLINVLLIEDNPGDVRLIRELLVKTDQTSFHLECVTRLSEGLARLSRDGIDVVLLDLSLPDSRGFQTFATVQDQASQVPIIVLTALDDEALATRAMRDGAQDYLLKGHVDTNMLVRAIRYAIERKRVEEALRHSENQYRTTIDSMGDAIHVVDRDLRILLFNETFRRWNEELGLESNVFGKALYEVFPFLPDTVRDEYHQVFKSGRVLVTEECTTIQDHEFMTETRKIPVFEDKAVARVVTVVRDISGRKRGEEALRESEGKYRNLIDNSRDAIYLLYDGKFEIINKRFEELFGYTQDDTNAPDFNFINLVAPQSRGLIKERVQKVEKGESVHPQYEFTAITRDGREVEVETSVSYIEYKGGIATQGILRDITERKRAEEVLRERAARLGVIASIGQKTTVIMELDELLHHAVNLIGETFNYYNVIILLVDESEIVLRATTLPFLKPLEGQVRLRIGSEGITGWVAEHGEPLVIPDVIQDARYVAALEEMDVQSEMAVPIVSKGTVIGVLDAQNSQRDAFTQDDVFTLQTLADQLAVAIENARLYEQASQEIGERKRIEESLRIERDKLRNILDNMNDQVVIENESFHIIYQNRKSIETVGDKSGSTCYETFRNRRQPCDQHFCSVKHVLKEKGNGPYCYTTEAKDGLNWEVVALPISDEKGQRVVLEIVRDITERKQLQEQLLQSEKMSAVGQLISGVAHELNNPLTGILGFSQLLLMSQDLQESARHSIETIHHEAERARKIVQNLLTFSRHRKATKKKVFINEIVGQTLDLRAYEMRVSNIEIIRTFDSKCPPIHGDDHQLQQVFMNLIINAEQAMLEAHGKGHLEVTTTVDKEKNVVQIRFQDDGPGIDEGHLSKVFDPFFTTKPVGKGTGLGLSISYGIIQEHGGRIQAFSTKGQGATFTIELPVFDMNRFQTVSSPQKERERRRVEGKRILVVDDEQAVVELLKETLEGEGHVIEVAYDGDSALEKLAEDRFDAVISDLKMPGKSGIHIYQYCQRKKPNLARHFLFLTGDIGSANSLCFLEEQRVPYVSKPCDINEIVTHLEILFSEERRRILTKDEV